MVITENNVGGSQESVSTVWNSQEYNLLSVSMGLTSWPNQPGMQRIQEKKCVCIEVQMLDIIYKEYVVFSWNLNQIGVVSNLEMV